MKTKKDYLEELSFNFIKRFISHTEVVRNNGDYFDKKDHVKALLRRLKKEECEYVNQAYKQGKSAEEISNEFNVKFRPDEKVVKNKFVSHLKEDKLNPKKDVMFFEFPVGNNRSDINIFNGSSFTYELKSPRDSKRRIVDQISTYKKIFEYVYLVISADMKKDIDLNLSTTGIITYSHPDFNFEWVREPRQNEDLNPSVQLSILRIPELQDISKLLVDDRDMAPKAKREYLISEIKDQFSPGEINEIFKRKIKNRYH